MTQVNLYDVMTTIQDLFEADPITQSIGPNDNDTVKVEVETTWSNRVGDAPVIKIYADSWESPPDQEKIGGYTSNRTKTFANIVIMCVTFDYDNEVGSSDRDLLFRKAKEVLKKNRKLSGKVEMSRLIGGEFQNARSAAGNGFWHIATINLQVEYSE